MAIFQLRTQTKHDTIGAPMRVTYKTSKRQNSMAFGRPTRYKNEYCDIVLETMAEGYSKTATAGKIGICKTTFDNWCKKYPDFMGAVKIGEAGRTFKLETDLLAAKDGPNVTSRIFALKNCAPDEWKDRQSLEHTGPGGGAIKTEDVTKRDAESFTSSIAGLVAKHGAQGGTQEADTEDEGSA